MVINVLYTVLVQSHFHGAYRHFAPRLRHRLRRRYVEQAEDVHAHYSPKETYNTHINYMARCERSSALIIPYRFIGVTFS